MTDMGKIDDRDTITFVRQLPGPIERVWSYLTEPKFLSTWLSDGTVADRIGGEVRLDMGAHGRITAYDPPRLLEYTWSEPEHGDKVDRVPRSSIDGSLVRWELAEVRDGVRLTLTHSRLPQSEVVPHILGWHALLDRMSAHANGREPEPFADLHARCRPSYDDLIRTRARSTR